MGYCNNITSKIGGEQDIIIVGTGVIIVNKSKEILIAKRTDNGQWSLPGGSLEVGERLEECIIRETIEETGIVIKEEGLELNSAKSILEPIDKNGRQLYIVSITYKTRNYDDRDFNIDKREFTEHKWINIDEIDEIGDDKFTPYALVALKEYRKIN